LLFLFFLLLGLA